MVRLSGKQITVQTIGKEMDLQQAADEIERLNCVGEYQGKQGEFSYSGSRNAIVFFPYAQETRRNHPFIDMVQ